MSSTISKIAWIDFEFNGSSNKFVNPVCLSLTYKGETEEYWLHSDPKGCLKAKRRLLEIGKEGGIFASWAVEAEARSFLSLDLNPLRFKWIDLMTEYRQLLNHNHNMAYGRQLIKGKVKYTKPPKNKWEMTEEDKKKADRSKPEYNLAAGIFKLLKIQIDTDHKTEVRDLIISAPDKFTQEQKTTIQDYCTSDIVYLEPAFKRMLQEYKRLLDKEEMSKLLGWMLKRGEYSARTALMVTEGYGFNYEATRAFADSVPDIIYSVQKDINEQFPKILPFKTDKKKHTRWDQKITKKWVKWFAKKNNLNWDKTKKKDYSLSKDAFAKYFNYRHDYPRGNFGAQMVRYLNLKQSLNGFLPSNGKKKTFWDSVGDDGMVRPYFGIYGSQSSRSQPAATGFLFLKSAWIRALCVPPSGFMYVGIDYGSQEFLLAALMSKDKNMINAYLSGDPYFYFAKLAGAVPWDGERKDYEDIRTLFKSTVLGLSYGMGKFLLALKLTADTGKKVTEEEAQKLIIKFQKAFPVYHLWKIKTLRQYKLKKKLTLPCGWMMFGDNDNDKSVGNFPVQGFGASILRKAVELAQDRGITVVKTLHDALYIKAKVGDWKEVDKFADCMTEAFQFYFEGEMKELAQIRLDGNAWSPELANETIITDGGLEVKCQDIYIDGRAKKEYEKFKKYFTPVDYEVF